MADLVSVIVPIYNAEKTLQRCVESIINQSYQDIQVILVDDGSNDASLALCKKITNIDVRCIVLEKKNGGVSSARNVGLDVASGKYIIFVDSDDWLAEDMIERYVDLMVVYSADIVIGGLSGISVQNQNTFIKKVPLVGKQDRKLWNRICDSSEIFGYIGGKMFKKEIIDSYIIRFNENMYAQEDLNFCLSYYDVIDNFYLTDYVGYKYLYEGGKRIPPYCDFIRNQLKLLSMAEKNYELEKESYSNIQGRMEGYIYMMFYEAKSKEDIYKSYNQMKQVDGLDGYLSCCRFKGEIKHIISWYLKGKCERIFWYFKIRCLIKKLMGRN